MPVGQLPNNHGFRASYRLTHQSVDFFRINTISGIYYLRNRHNVAFHGIGEVPVTNPTRIAHERTRPGFSHWPTRGQENFYMQIEAANGVNTAYIGGARCEVYNEDLRRVEGYISFLVNTGTAVPSVIQTILNQTYQEFLTSVLTAVNAHFDRVRAVPVPAPTPHLGSTIAEYQLETTNEWGNDPKPTLRFGNPTNGVRPFYLDVNQGTYEIGGNSQYNSINRHYDDIPPSKATTPNSGTGDRAFSNTAVKSIKAFYPMLPNNASLYKRGFTYTQIRIQRKTNARQYRYIVYIIDTRDTIPRLIRQYFLTGNTSKTDDFYDIVEDYSAAHRGDISSAVLQNQVRVQDGSPVPGGALQKYGNLVPEPGTPPPTSTVYIELDHVLNTLPVRIVSSRNVQTVALQGGTNTYNIQVVSEQAQASGNQLYWELIETTGKWKLVLDVGYTTYGLYLDKGVTDDFNHADYYVKYSPYRLDDRTSKFYTYFEHTDNFNQPIGKVTAVRVYFVNIEDNTKVQSCTFIYAPYGGVVPKHVGTLHNANPAEITRVITNIANDLNPTYSENAGIYVRQTPSDWPMPVIQPKITMPDEGKIDMGTQLPTPRLVEKKDDIWYIQVGQLPDNLPLPHRCLVITRTNAPTNADVQSLCTLNILPDDEIIDVDMSDYDKGSYQFYINGYDTFGEYHESDHRTLTKDSERATTSFDYSDQTGAGSAEQSDYSHLEDGNILGLTMLDDGRCNQGG